MSNIVFEYTKMSHYAAQGGTASGAEGYDIWLEGSDWLGYCPIDEFQQWVYHYQQQGENVYLKDKK